MTLKGSPPLIPVPWRRPNPLQNGNSRWPSTGNSITGVFNQHVQLIAQASCQLDNVLAAVALQANQLSNLTPSDRSGPSRSRMLEREVGREDGEEVPE